MSSNNQLVVLKNKKGLFEVHINSCVDNDFNPSKKTLIKSNFKDITSAAKFAIEYEHEEMIEYTTLIDNTCFSEKIKKDKKLKRSNILLN